MVEARDPHAAALAAMQPYWRTPGESAGLTPADRAALAADVMPPGAVRAGRRSAATTAKVALAMTLLGLASAGAGAAMLLAGVDPDAGPGPKMVLVGGLLVLVGAPLALSSLLTKRRYLAARLARVTDTLVDVRRSARVLVRSRYMGPLELRLRSGLVIEVPVAADALGQALVTGRTYTLWYLPSAYASVQHTLIYLDAGAAG